MLARIRTSTIFGIEAVPVEVEVQVRQGESKFSIIGLADNAVRESRDRVRSALKNSGFSLSGEVLVNLSPAEIKKEGAGFDLPIALGVLVASGQLKAESTVRCMAHGELALDGRLKPVRGAVAFAVRALQDKVPCLVVPKQNSAEAALIEGLNILAPTSLAEAVALLTGRLAAPVRTEVAPPPRETAEDPLAAIIGQESAKRAAVIAAAGAHNMLMIGPPGCGKSMLASRIPALLPALTRDEMLEVVRVHSIAGTPIEPMLSGERPFRNPHHIISDAGLAGGGSDPRPGELSLAHCGVLFLDEFPEYRRSAVEALRAPLESGVVCVSRARGSVSFPARVQLVAAMNPCPCGRLGVEGKRCICSAQSIQRYLSRLSQPILDRIDLHVELQAVPAARMAEQVHEPAAHRGVRVDVARARSKQLGRQGCLNSQLGGEQLRRIVRPDQKTLSLLERAADKLGLTARGYFRVLRVARSIADIADEQELQQSHVAEALSFRSLERLKQYCAQ